MEFEKVFYISFHLVKVPLFLENPDFALELYPLCDGFSEMSWCVTKLLVLFALGAGVDLSYLHTELIENSGMKYVKGMVGEGLGKKTRGRKD